MTIFGMEPNWLLSSIMVSIMFLIAAFGNFEKSRTMRSMIAAFMIFLSLQITILVGYIVSK